VRPELLTGALRDAKVSLKVPPAIEDGSHYAWEAVLYKGIAYAQTILDLERPVVVKG